MRILKMRNSCAIAAFLAVAGCARATTTTVAGFKPDGTSVRTTQVTAATPGSSPRDLRNDGYPVPDNAMFTSDDGSVVITTSTLNARTNLRASAAATTFTRATAVIGTGQASVPAPVQDAAYTTYAVNVPTGAGLALTGSGQAVVTGTSTAGYNVAVAGTSYTTPTVVLGINGSTVTPTGITTYTVSSHNQNTDLGTSNRTFSTGFGSPSAFQALSSFNSAYLNASSAITTASLLWDGEAEWSILKTPSTYASLAALQLRTIGGGVSAGTNVAAGGFIAAIRDIMTSGTFRGASLNITGDATVGGGVGADGGFFTADDSEFGGAEFTGPVLVNTGLPFPVGLTVRGDALFDGFIAATRDVMTSGNLRVSEDAFIGGSITAPGGALLGGTIVNGGLESTANFTADGSATVNGAAILNSTITDGVNGLNFNSVGTDSPSWTIGSPSGSGDDDFTYYFNGGHTAFLRLSVDNYFQLSNRSLAIESRLGVGSLSEPSSGAYVQAPNYAVTAEHATSTNYTITSTDGQVYVTGAGLITLTINPSGFTSGQKLHVYDLAVGAVTITSSSGTVVFGRTATTYVLNPATDGSAVTLTWTTALGTGKFVIGD